MTNAKGGSVASGVGYGEGCPLHSRLGDLGERREYPSGPDRKRNLAYFEGHRKLLLYLYNQI